VEVGAQDCYWEPSGAFTGAVSAAMLAGWCRWVIVGHSERRLQFGETDETVARKAAAALSNQLGVILCVGESEEENGAGRTDEVVTHQLGAALAGCAADDVALLAIAYEPVWAIGTGRSADPEHAYKAMRTIRHLISEALGKGAAKKVRVLYGGSVSSENVQSYVELPNCDGCLVGGASLRADEFSNMIRVVAEVYGEGR
ncbi:MAG: triose-phosphate isomerase, partial [Candidatus Dormibacteraceae bacterium]